MNRDQQIILSLLNAIEEDSYLTQKDLATRLDVAVGMVNSYLKRIIYKGYVKTKSLERRRLRYLLTPSGVKEKSRLTLEFLQFSYQFIRKVREKVIKVLTPYKRNGKKKVIFYGSGEVAELAYLAVRELGMELKGIVDPDRVGHFCVDHKIQNLDWLKNHSDSNAILLDLSHNFLQKKTSSNSKIQRQVLDLGLEYIQLT